MTQLKQEHNMLRLKTKSRIPLKHIGKNLQQIEINIMSNSKVPLFQISNTLPPVVAQVSEECIKRQLNIQPGDYVYEINKRNVSRASAKTVRKLIKSANSLTLVLYRPDEVSKPLSLPQQSHKSSLFSKYIKLFQKSLTRSSCVEPKSNKLNLTSHIEYHNTIESNVEIVKCSNPDKTTSMQITKIISKTSNSLAQFDHKLEDITIDHGYASIPTSFKSSVTSLSSVSINNCTNQQLIDNIKIEMNQFLIDIQNGIEIYVRPSIVLNIISKQECLQLYQNVEKLIPVTKFMLNVFNSIDLSTQLPNAESLKIVFASFKTYLNGLPDAIDLLGYLSCQNNNFILFLEKINDLNSLKIFDFIFMPFNFICKMIDYLKQIESCCQFIDEPNTTAKFSRLLEDLFEFTIETQKKLELKFDQDTSIETHTNNNSVRVQIKDNETISNWQQAILSIKKNQLLIEFSDESQLSLNLNLLKCVEAAPMCSQLNLKLIQNNCENSINKIYLISIRFDSEYKRNYYLNSFF